MCVAISTTCVRTLIWCSSFSMSVIRSAKARYASKASLTLVCVVTKECVIASTLYLRMVMSDWWVSPTNHLKIEPAKLEIAIKPSTKPADRFSRKSGGGCVNVVISSAHGIVGGLDGGECVTWMKLWGMTSSMAWRNSSKLSNVIGGGTKSMASLFGAVRLMMWLILTTVWTMSVV